MGTRNPQVDAYIKQAAPFAQPILTEFRAIVHEACPDVVEEMKWRFPHFTYKGMLCSMAAFKEHAAIGFWKGALVVGDAGKGGESMGHLGRLTSRGDLPSKRVLAGYVKKAMALNDAGVKVARPTKRGEPKPIRVPPDLAAAMKKNARAKATFDAFPPSHKRDYVEWITDAKTDDTRQRRLTQAVAWMAEGKNRNWKYERR